MSELPSDSEDVFFMEGEEAEEYQRKKRLQYWEEQRQARIEGIDAQEAEDHSGEESQGSEKVRRC